MKEFLIKLSTTGIKEKDLLKKEKDMITELVSLNAVKRKKDVFKLASKYRVGTMDISQNGTGYLEELSSKKAKKDLLVEKHDLNGSSRGDLVIAKRIFTKSGRPKAKVIFIVEKKFITSVIYTDEKQGRIIGVHIKTGLNVDITASQRSLKKLPLHTVLKLDNQTNTIMEVLGVLDDPKVDEKISLALYNKKEEFTKQSEAEAKSHGDFVDKSMYPDRVDLTHLPFCTIDPPDAKDFDDAVYFDTKETTLYVAIADVSEYVFAMGSIDKEAKERGFSIYFPHKSIPMLPRTLSENICSLKPDEERLTFTFRIKLDPLSLKPLKEELLETVILSKRRFTYDEIDKYLKGDFKNASGIDKEILKYLLPLNEITQKLRKKRLEKGFDFTSSEIRMKLDKNQNLIKTTIEKETPSHSLIEDCMLLANKAAAKYFKKGIFRTHEKPDFDKIHELLDDLALIGIFADFTQDIHRLILNIQEKADNADLREQVDRLIIKAQKQAKYTYENVGHFGLGFEKYTHFTSPIRRYSDLILHRLLKAIIKNDEKQQKYIMENIEPVTIRVSELERESDKVAWDFMDRKYARWAREKEGEIFEGIITDTDRNPIAVIEDEDIKGCRVFLSDQDVELFERVKVKILYSDIATARILGEIAGRI